MAALLAHGHPRGLGPLCGRIRPAARLSTLIYRGRHYLAFLLLLHFFVVINLFSFSFGLDFWFGLFEDTFRAQIPIWRWARLSRIFSGTSLGELFWKVGYNKYFSLLSLIESQRE